MPASRFEAVAPIVPLLHAKILFPVPPDAETWMLPLDSPKQLTDVTVPEITITLGAVIVNGALAAQPLASVAVTV